MIKILLDLLSRVVPSKIIINNCIELIQREQMGIKKYGVSLEDAKLTHEQVLQHLLEEQLDGANYIRKALMTASEAHTDYVLLRKEVEDVLRELQRIKLRPGRYSELEADQLLDYTSNCIKDALFRFDSEKVRRELRR